MLSNKLPSIKQNPKLYSIPTSTQPSEFNRRLLALANFQIKVEHLSLSLPLEPFSRARLFASESGRVRFCGCSDLRDLFWLANRTPSVDRRALKWLQPISQKPPRWYNGARHHHHTHPIQRPTVCAVRFHSIFHISGLLCGPQTN